MLENPWPSLQAGFYPKSSLAFAMVVPTSFLAERLQQHYPNYPLQCLIPPRLNFTSGPISGVSVGFQSSLSLQ